MKLFLPLTLLLLVSCKNQNQGYVCEPCDLSCDELVFAEPGTCPHCKMDLIKKSELVSEEKPILNKIDIQEGSGVFLIEGGQSKRDKTIEVHYHRPENFNTDSKILIVIPGADRNADSYRNSWLEASEKFNVLVLSLMYKEEDYGYGAYHLGNLMTNLNLANSVEYDKNSNNVFLNEDEFSADVNLDSEQWIFKDFDRIFSLVVDELDSSRTEYDIFGHSAGGQILHRSAIFQPRSKANRIVAANSGSYTLLDFSTDLPFGVKNAGLAKQNIKSSFKKNLTLFIGELDNENENGGLLLRSSTADKQGLHRLARGKHFYEKSKRLARELNCDFNWELKIVHGIGHNQKEMSKAAANLLYGSGKN